MEAVLSVPFQFLECPNLKLKKPGWIAMPSAMVVFSLVLVSYFLVTGGVIYDMIVEPPSIGSTTDEHGRQRPVAFMEYRVNGQYIMEGLASSFFFTLGGLGFVVLERSNAPGMARLSRILHFCVAFSLIIVSFVVMRWFIRIKIPGYLIE
ncbi:oligosaccharyltransferase complex subunit OSTC-like [Sycon ciliatum]|uniref:oligosaccharyltransferase complex subunit OSTC-like n=1 Tax=Sycon ciliatum TaxID=27933 RepID=UPI0031F72080